jgi:glutamine cyclotransferase
MLMTHTAQRKLLNQLSPLLVVFLTLALVCSPAYMHVHGTWNMKTAPRYMIPVYTYRIINTYPHDPCAFTQGLVFENGFLYEGTGLYGKSTLRKVELETGDVIQIHELSSEYFGEGVAIHQDRIFQLTYLSHKGFIYDKDKFTVLKEFTYTTEGWGLTYDGESLIMSDGTSTLSFRDPETFEEIHKITVYDNYGEVTRLNELEYINGEIYANIWQTDYIARISPQTGRVLGWIDLKGLLDLDYKGYTDILNGIAYDAEHDRLFVTGKLWPYLFEIELIILPSDLKPGKGSSFVALFICI